MSIVGRTYLERGRPVVVLLSWRTAWKRMSIGWWLRIGINPTPAHSPEHYPLRLLLRRTYPRSYRYIVGSIGPERTGERSP